MIRVFNSCIGTGSGNLKSEKEFTLAGGLAALPSLRSQRGFTLAEVLITLAIIGVVAAIVIPGLLNSSNENEFHAAAKKAYGALSQATLRMTTENGGDIWDDSTAPDQGFWSTTNGNNMRNAYRRYMDFTRVGLTANIFTKPVYFYKGTGLEGFNNADVPLPAASRVDGTLMDFFSYQNCVQTCTAVNGAAGCTLSNICGSINVDINGLKGPNMIGRDLYSFWIIKNSNGAHQVIPVGSNGDGFSCAINGPTSTTSWGCSYYVMTDRQLP